jgi:ribonuclease P protein component
LVVHVRTSAQTHPARAGFVVGRVVGPAVTRNRVRRQLRHLTAARLDQFAAGTDLVIRATPAAAECSGPQLAALLDGLLTRAQPRDHKLAAQV